MKKKLLSQLGRGLPLGSIDKLSSNEVFGWLPTSDGESQGFLYCNSCGENLLTFKSEIARPDVEEKFPDQKRCGFHIYLNHDLKVEHSSHIVSFKVGMNTLADSDGQTHFIFPSANQRIYVFVCELFDFLGEYKRPTGIQRYTVEVIRALRNSLDSITFVSLQSDRTFTEIKNSLIDEFLDFERQGRNLDSILRKIQTQKQPLSTEFKNADIFFVPGASWAVNGASEAIVDLVSAGVAYVPFVYDLIPIVTNTSDEATSIAFKNFINQTLRYASRVICLSKSTENDLINYGKSIQIDAPPTEVLGARVSEHSKLESSNEFISSKIKQKFVLIVSTIEPRKGFEKLLSLYENSKTIRQLPQLVIVGRKGWKNADLLEKISLLESEGLILTLSAVHDSYLDQLYRKAQFTVFPSDYEGWGLPIGESLSRGTPCLTGTNSSLREAGGDSAIYFNDEKEFQELFVKLATDDNFLEEAKLKVKNFSQPSEHEWGNRLVHSLSGVKPIRSARAPRIKTNFEYCANTIDEVRSLEVFGSLTGNQVSEISQKLAENCIFGALQPETLGRWLSSGGGLRFVVDSIESELSLVLVGHTPANGILEIEFASGETHRNLVIGRCPVVIDFKCIQGTTTEIRFKFLGKKIQDERSLSFFLHSFMVIPQSDVRTLTLSLFHFESKGKHLFSSATQ